MSHPSSPDPNSSAAVDPLHLDPPLYATFEVLQGFDPPREGVAKLLQLLSLREKTGPLDLAAFRGDFEQFAALFPPQGGVLRSAAEVGGVPCEWARPAVAGRGVVIYFHGGGYVSGSVATHRDLVCRLAKSAEFPVLSVGYRLAPEHPYPAALEDARAVYTALLAQGRSPQQIVLAGDSAGAGLCLALLMNLRDRGEPLPAGAALLSPWVDLTHSGPSIESRRALDPVLQPRLLRDVADAYLQGDDPRQPSVSPLFGSFEGLPPLEILVGTREILLDDARRVAAAAYQAGIDVRLEIWRHQVHVWPLFASLIEEGQEAIEQLGAFCHLRLSSAT
ncbi:MAG: alpha/beta hydrolase [Acidobacteriota bacterium]